MAGLQSFFENCAVSEKRLDAPLTRLALILFCLILVALRLPESILAPAVVLNDGATFVLTAKLDGFLSLLTTQEGYFSVFPRLSCAIAAHFPAATALIFSLSAYAALALVCGYLSSPRFELRAKYILAITLTLLPAKAYWIHSSPLNSIWVLALLLPLFLVIREPQSLRIRIVDCLVLLLACLSSPLILWLIPLPAYRYIRHRDFYSLLLLLSAGLAWTIQLYAFTSSYLPRSSDTFSVDWEAWQQVVVAYFAGPLTAFPVSQEVAFLLFGFLLLLYLLLTHCFVKYRAHNQQWFWYAITSTGLVIMLSYSGNPRELYWHIERYRYFAGVLLVWQVFAALQLSGRSQRWLYYCCVIFAVIGTVQSIATFHRGNPGFFRSPCFPDLAQRTAECEQGLSYRWYSEK